MSIKMACSLLKKKFPHQKVTLGNTESNSSPKQNLTYSALKIIFLEFSNTSNKFLSRKDLRLLHVAMISGDWPNARKKPEVLRHKQDHHDTTQNTTAANILFKSVVTLLNLKAITSNSQYNFLLKNQKPQQCATNS